MTNIIAALTHFALCIYNHPVYLHAHNCLPIQAPHRLLLSHASSDSPVLAR